MARLIIYVHGTYAADTSSGTAKLGIGEYSGTSGEGEAIKRMVAAQCGSASSVILKSYYWSGGDTYSARSIAAATLKAVLEGYSGQEIALVTHSHGGNVVGHALEQLGRSHAIRAVYLFACPIMTGSGKAWWTEGRKRIGNLHTFSTPNDAIQVKGAYSRNAIDRTATGKLNYSVGYQIDGVKDISLQATQYGNESHGWMHSEEAFLQAAKKLA